MRFVDQAEITVRSGKGGNGCVSFRRERFVPRGGPDGGNGGKGGDVLARASESLMTLYDFRVKRLYAAENGKPGQGSQKYGRNGEDLVLELPVGTQVLETGLDGEDALVADLDEPGREIVLARGGRGGKGNEHFKTSTNRTPRFAQPGEEGEERRLRLELKILADCGLLGLPNAGKSTLISRISAARPKVAAYPFTTLSPNLGVVADDLGRRMVIADIPGLIEGASQGQGLGHTFLRHVERTRFLVHIAGFEELDLAADDPLAVFSLINEELALFDPGLARKPQIEVVNKIDLASAEQAAAVRELAAARPGRLFPISALTGEGVEELLAEMWRLNLEEGS